MTTATASTPLDVARAQLQAALSARHSGMALPAPYVVPLGAADTLGFGHRDPYAGTRPAANVQLTSRAVLIGPWGGGPSEGACGQCLAMRWQRLRSRSEREALELGHEPRGAVHWPVLTRYAVDAVWATYSAVLGGHGSRPDAAPASPRSTPASPEATPADRALPQVTRIDLATLATATFPLLPEPLCPACVTEVPDTAEAARMELGPTPKPDPDGYRLRTLDSYPLPTAALANPVCGALGSDTWINPASTTTAPVAGTHFVRGYAGLNDVTWSGQANRYATSRTLAYLEGLERYAGTHRRRGTSPVVDSYRNLAGQALNPADCGFYAPGTYASDPLVSPFDPDRAIPWVWGHSLRDDRPILVPARLAHYSAGVDADNFVFECSNGCATGGSPEEAILFGLLELVERDAFLLAWYGRARLTAIDLATATTPAVRSMLDRAALHGYDVHAFDTRMDLAVPVVTALAVRRDGGHGTLSFSAAAGFDPADTVEAALSEVLTYIPHLPYQVAERRTELEAMERDFTKVLHLKDHAQLYGLPSMTRHAAEYLEPAAVLPLEEAFADWQPLRPRTGDLLDDLRCLRDQLTAGGYDVIAVDQTTPEQRRMGLHTVSTTVPGLLPLDFGWTRQRALHMPRLRTALRAAGRRADDLPEAEIKAVPHPFP
ncbi:MULTISPECIES: TOMM precursor leader peptide-binding protein [Streptomyces]|uniref:TOMM precursor leader peptide-binding protein n=1 Tax=Streptomyces TaxID=1883 RepID=UPI000D506565|nr:MULTISPECIES: TOMM precursor leader peptide-binding protein [Streptomyces]NYS19914.1 TOMM precursor leader peptide-binding protein [Streptomyces sp. SJ1-7]PVC67266.1 cyclodehydratase [Streptomyces sp. CS065A]